MNFYTIIISAHSIIRWIFLLMLLVAVFNSIKKWISHEGLNHTDKLINTIVVIISHIQLVIGLSLYMVSPKVVFDTYTMSSPILRFFTLEHTLLMLIAIVLLTVGNIKSKRNVDSVKSAKSIVIWFSISLFIILISIPWPFRNLGSGWI